MTQLEFSVLDIVADKYAAVPTLDARLRIKETTDQIVHAMALRCQVRIEPHKRRYSDAEEAGLIDLFGSRSRYAGTLKAFQWMQANATVPGFTGSTEATLPMPCTYDFEVTGAKYLHALRDGEIPLVLLFSGTVFTKGASGFTVEQISWSCEASHRLPVVVWRELMDAHFPGGGWIRIHRDTIDALVRYKSARGLTTWEEAFDRLLTLAEHTNGEPVR